MLAIVFLVGDIGCKEVLKKSYRAKAVLPALSAGLAARDNILCDLCKEVNKMRTKQETERRVDMRVSKLSSLNL